MRYARPLAVLATCAVLGAAPRAGAATDTRGLMPVPASVSWKPGALAVDGRFSIGLAGPDDGRVQRAAVRFCDWVQGEAKLAKAPKVARGAGLLSVSWKNAGTPAPILGEDESYELVVDARGAKLTASGAVGVLRGLETVKQLVAIENGKASMAAVEIKDRPRFAWRGLLIDPCRHWMPVEVVKRTLDGMAAVKMNVLHWHLSEYQGFRIESKAFPKLHELAGEGQFYTQDQVKDVVAYARDRGIRVVPEFDMPGHTTSFLVAYPELGVAPGPYVLRRTWEVFDDTLDPTNEDVYAFLEKFWTEMSGLFPDAYVHIGGDEVTPRAWDGDARIQGFIADHDLRDAKDLQAYFNKRLGAILAKLNRKMVGWDEVLHKDLPKDAVVQSWRGTASLATAVKMEHDAILSEPYYLDHMLSAATHYAADPIPAGSDLTPEQRQRVLGGEACMWAEFVTPENIDVRIWPRAAAIAERLWSPADVTDVADMYRRLEVTSLRLAGLGLSHRSTPDAMLKRLAGDQPVEPLQRLASLVEPVKRYERMDLHAYTQATPLDRFVDAVPPESEMGRILAGSVAGFIAGTGDKPPLRMTLEQIRQVRDVVPVLAGSPKLAELRTLPGDVEALALIAHKCLDFTLNRRPVPRDWVNESWLLMDEMEKPRGEVQLAIVMPIRKLLIAFWNAGKLKDVALPDRNRWVEDEIKRIQTEQAAQRGGH
jgi:hexosaminidase